MRSLDLDRLLETAALEDVEAPDCLLRLGKRAIGDQRLSIADANRARAPRRGQLVAARNPLAPVLDVVQPGKVSSFRASPGSGSVWASILPASQQTSSKHFIVAPLSSGTQPTATASSRVPRTAGGRR